MLVKMVAVEGEALKNGNESESCGERG